MASAWGRRVTFRRLSPSCVCHQPSRRVPCTRPRGLFRGCNEEQPTATLVGRSCPEIEVVGFAFAERLTYFRERESALVGGAEGEAGGREAGGLHPERASRRRLQPPDPALGSGAEIKSQTPHRRAPRAPSCVPSGAGPRGPELSAALCPRYRVCSLSHSSLRSRLGAPGP